MRKPYTTDITGRNYGRLKVLSFYKSINGHSRWLCQCSCENKKVVEVSSLNNGTTKSCGCLRNELRSLSVITHGHTRKNEKGGHRTSEYATWEAMKARCCNPNDKGWKDYGGRGIVICERWMRFENFFADMGKRPKGKSINRVNNSLGYYKENCKWSSPKEQQRNTRANVLLTFQGKTQPLIVWTEELKIPMECLRARIKRNWTTERALLTPVSSKKNMGKTESRTVC